MKNILVKVLVAFAFLFTCCSGDSDNDSSVITLSTFYKEGHKKVKIGMTSEEFQKIFPESKMNRSKKINGDYSNDVYYHARYEFDDNNFLRYIYLPQKSDRSNIGGLRNLDQYINSIQFSYPQYGNSELYGQLWNCSDYYIYTELVDKHRNVMKYRRKEADGRSGRIVVHFERKDEMGKFTKYLNESVIPNNNIIIQMIDSTIIDKKLLTGITGDPVEALDEYFESWASGRIETFHIYNKQFYVSLSSQRINGLENLARIAEFYQPIEFSFNSIGKDYTTNPDGREFKYNAIIKVKRKDGHEETMREQITVTRADQNEILIAKHYGFNLEKEIWLFNFDLKSW